MFLLFYKEVTNLYLQIKWVNLPSSFFFCFLILYLRNVSLIAFISLMTTFIGTLSSRDVVEHNNPILKTNIRQTFILLLTLTCRSSIIALSSMSSLCFSSLTSSSSSPKNISRSNISMLFRQSHYSELVNAQAIFENFINRSFSDEHLLVSHSYKHLLAVNIFYLILMFVIINVFIFIFIFFCSCCEKVIYQSCSSKYIYV